LHPAKTRSCNRQKNGSILHLNAPLLTADLLKAIKTTQII